MVEAVVEVRSWHCNQSWSSTTIPGWWVGGWEKNEIIALLKFRCSYSWSWAWNWCFLSNIVYCYLFIYYNCQHKSYIFMILHSVVQTVFIWPVILSFLLAIKLTIMFNIEYCQQCSIVYLILLSYSFVYLIVLSI